jgi:hypothetical protein
MHLERGSGSYTNRQCSGFGSEVKIQELQWLKMEPWRAVGWTLTVEAVYQWSQIRITLMRSRIRIYVKSWIRIRNPSTGWMFVYVCLVSGYAEDGGDPVCGVEDPGNGRRVRVLHLHLHPDDDVVPPFCTNSQRSFFATEHETIFSSTKVMKKTKTR